jgi:hypothetical protein
MDGFAGAFVDVTRPLVAEAAYAWLFITAVGQAGRQLMVGGRFCRQQSARQ